MPAKKRPADDLEAASAPDLIIALDFGTTYSGVAYCFTNQRDPKPTAILEWPGNQGKQAPKVPTLISYDSSDLTDVKWGACADKDAKSNVISGVKLLLDPSQQRPAYFAVGISESTSLPKPPTEIATDYIKHIYDYSLLRISQTVPNGYVEQCSKKFVVTVPGVWSDAAKHATLEAAKAAGLDPVTMIKEPEAAALFTAQTLDFALKTDDAFVICDAGGGTVDLISYQVECVNPTLQVKELVPGTGGMSGSIGLNLRFAAEVQALVGEEQWRILQGSRGWANAKKQFDQEIKKAFNGDASQDFFVNFPLANLDDDPERGLQSNSWIMTSTALERIFDPLIKDIIKLISDQVERSKGKLGGRDVTGILLVGGFGSSLYLRDRIMEQFPRIQVLQPNDAWAAVMKGAVLSQLPSQVVVTSTSATRHYGVEVHSVYCPVQDAGQAVKTWRDGSTRCQTMKWYIETGDDLARDQKINFPVFRDISKNYTKGDIIFTLQLYQCEDSLAPRHRSKGEKVAVNCTCISDMSSLPKSHFRKKRDRFNKIYYEVHFDLVVTFVCAVMTFSAEVNGKTMGSVKVQF